MEENGRIFYYHIIHLSVSALLSFKREGFIDLCWWQQELHQQIHFMLRFRIKVELYKDHQVL